MTVEIIGRACVAPGANSPDELFQLLREERCTVTEIPDNRWDKSRYWHPEVGTVGKTYTFAAGIIDDVYDFDPAVFGLSPRESESLDPQQRITLKLTWRALEDANISPSSLRHERVGVYVGASNMEYGNLIVGDPAAASPYYMTGNTLSVIANRVSHVLGVHGPSLVVDTACSSGLVALDMGVKALMSGDIDTAIIGSVSVLGHPLSFVGFAQARMLSPQGLCRAYDNQAEGYVRAEGGVVFILRRTDRVAQERDRSHAKILATGVNSAGRTTFISLPSGKAQGSLLNSIYSSDEINVSRLAFIEGHGTGTKVGDPAEVWSIGTEIGRKRSAPIPIGSIKSNIGHTEPASGLFGIMKATLALENNYLPPSLHFETPNEDIDFQGLNVTVAAEGIPLLRGRKPRLAAVNSFGFGGTNAHVVLSDPDATAPVTMEKQADRVFLASAQSASSLKALLSSYRDVIAGAPKTEKAEVLGAISANRQRMRHRFVAHGHDAATVVNEIDAFVAGREILRAETGEAVRDQARTAFVFSGNGSQWAGMGVDAFRQSEDFRSRFKVVDALFRSNSDLQLTSLLDDPDLATKLADTRIAQPLLFAVQAALADSLIHWGLRPEMTFGHSIGEVAAAYVAGAVSLVDAVSIVAKRSKHQHKVAGTGKMMALAVGADDAAALIQSAGLPDIVVAAVNSRSGVTLSGPTDQISAFVETAEKNRIATQILDIDYPFHHPSIDVAKSDFLRDLSEVGARSSRIPFISTVTGKVHNGEALDPRYWWRNIREPVRFDAAAKTAIGAGCAVFIEFGPRPILASYLRDSLRVEEQSGVVIPTLVRKPTPPSVDPVRKIFAKALAIGASFDNKKACGERNASIGLPLLPFEDKPFRYSYTPEALDIYGSTHVEERSLAGWRVDPNSSAWRNHIDAHLYPDLAQHVVEGRSILPGSAFLDIILSAARRYAGDDDFEVSNVEILHPMELSTTRMLEVSTTVSAETGRVEVKSRERLKSDDWTLHAVARIRTAVSEVDSVVPAIPHRTKSIGAAHIYGVAKRFGLEYGPKFQLAETVTEAGERTIDVQLRPSDAPANPFVSYSLDPVATDAAFHGLVAMFDRFAKSAGGAPYVPVRFGLVQLHQPSAPVRRALIEIERMSMYSLKARVRLLDANDKPVATLSDCRFRRTHLRSHKPLEAQTYHYETVASSVTLRRSAGPLLPRIAPSDVQFVPTLDGPDEASLLLDAAAYRASYDIASQHSVGNALSFLATHTGDITADSFLVTLLRRLEDAGLASEQDTGWKLVDPCPLPDFEEIISQFLQEAPQRSTEVMDLIEAYQTAIAKPVRSVDSDAPAPAERGKNEQASAQTPSRALREHTLLQNVSALLERTMATGGGPLHIIELGATSRTFSIRLADLIAAHSGRLTIVEASDRLRNELEIALEKRAEVAIVPALDETMQAGNAIVSTSENAFGLLEIEGATKEFARAIFAKGGGLLAAVEVPSALSDILSAHKADWYARTIDPEFPIGKLATAGEWARLADELGASSHVVSEPFGSNEPSVTIAMVGAASEKTAARDHAHEARIITGDPVAAELRGRLDVTIATGDEPGDRAAFAELIETAPDLQTVYVPAQFDGDNDAETLLANIASLSALVKQLAQAADARSYRPKLSVLMPYGSAIVTDAPDAEGAYRALHTALWSFLRVARNEYPGIDIHSFDIRGAAGIDEALQLALELTSAEAPNREWLVDAATGDVRELRVVPGQVSVEARSTRDFAAATLKQDAISQIGSLQWTEMARPEPGDNEVCIEVAATALNFRDVMWAIGLLPEEALEDGFAGVSIGMECAGKVVSFGSGITDLKIGDRVTAIAPNAFSTHVVSSRSGVERIPDHVPTLAAATLPVVFLTAYYAMVELGRLQEGETVLIHGGAGGVGLAALQIAKARGATVIATAGTVAKRRLLTMLGADHVLDSRSLDFVPRTMEITGQEGVDVVLNSLFGEAMERGISLLKPFGRFLELGKRDFFADSKIGLRPFRRNISYFGIDADQLLKSQPKLTSRLFRDMSLMFDNGDLTPVAFRAFAPSEVRDAFRLMQGSGHVGKIVVTPPQPGIDAVKAPGRPLEFDPDGVHLVVGGIGGFGLAAANWLVEHGAHKIALCSRRGIVDEATRASIDIWRKAGVETTVHACDATNEAAVREMLAKLRVIGPLKTVLHAAMVLDDALLANLDRARNQPVIEAKVKSADVLDRLTRGDRLDHFIMFSSATTTVGNPGQANYVAANGYLEGLALARRLAGLPAIAASFGAIADVGYLASNDATSAALAKRIGKAAMTGRDALERLAECISLDPGTPEAAVVTIAEINWRIAKALSTTATPLYTVVNRGARHQAAGLSEDDFDLAGLIEGKSPQEGERLIFDFVAREIAVTLRVPASEITQTKIVREIGIDSLMAMELGMNFQQKTGFDLPLSSVTDTTTVGEIAHKLYVRVANAEVEAEAPADKTIDKAIIDRLAERHSEDPAAAVNQ